MPKALVTPEVCHPNDGRPAVFKATPKSAGGKAKRKAKEPSAFKDLWMQVARDSLS